MPDAVRNSEAEYIIQKVLDNLTDRYMVQEDNLFKVDRLFLASTVIRDVVGKKFSGELDDEACKKYFIYVEKFLKGEIEMFWEDGEVKVKSNTNYEEERRRALRSLQEAYAKMLGTSENQPKE